jgi:class 3 adenylate cyclase
MRTVRFLSLAAAFIIAASTVTLAQFPVTVCVTCRVKREPQTMHAEYAARYYASEYPNLAVSTKLLGSYEASGTTQRTVIRALVANGSDCNVLVGPGTDTIALPMNPIVDLLWIDYSATSTELDSRYMYPLYSRVNPNDEDATKGYASFLQRLKWTNLDLLCVDQAYERSVVTGITAVLNGLGGSLTSPVCLQADASVAAVSAELARIQKSYRRVVFVAMSTSNPVWNSFVTAVKNVTGLTFLFSESACSSATQPWLVIPGAFCATFAVSSTQFAPFRAAYLARDRTWASNAYAALGWPQSAIDFTGTAVYPVYATDATRFALRALSQYAAQYGKMPATAAAAAAYMRNTTMVGATGIVAIPNGKRGASDMTIYNSRSDGTYVIVANSTATGTLTIAPNLFVYSRQYAIDDVPPSVDESATQIPNTESNNNDKAIAAAVVVCLLIIVGVAAVVAKVAMGKSTRDNRDAPQDASVPFTIMFTDIEASTAQWATNPEVMGPAVDQHHDLIRKALRRHNGYEVKTIGDSFMVAFKDPVDALAASIDIEQTLFAAMWPRGIDDLYRQRVKETGLVPLANDLYEGLWSGIRVRIGVHTGSGSIKLDPVSQGYDYYGTVVNTAARVEGVAHGGQVLFSKSAFDAVKAQARGTKLLSEQTQVTELGPQPLRGLVEAVELMQVMPHEFASREFPALRLDNEVVMDEFGSGDDADPNDNESKLNATATDDTRSVYSHNSSNGGGGAGPSIPKDAPEYLLMRASKRSNAASFGQLLGHFQVLKASLSTYKAQERVKLVYDMAHKWRIAESMRKPAAQSAGALEKDVDRMIARIVAKAVPAAAAYQSPYMPLALAALPSSNNLTRRQTGVSSVSPGISELMTASPRDV